MSTTDGAIDQKLSYRGVGIANFNMATSGVAGGKATVNSVRISVLFENKVH